jgi:threonine/homoserine/homoserine lactone efflux protein
MAALGVGTGTILHIVAAALGLSAILATSTTAFTAVKVLGAAYLIYMAICMIRDSAGNAESEVIKPVKTSLQRIYAQGLISNVFNPKVAIFFLAFMPQFISESSDNKALAFLILGLVFNFNGMIWCHLLALVSSTTSRKLSVNKSARIWLLRLTAGLFGMFGVTMLLSSQN